MVIPATMLDAAPGAVAYGDPYPESWGELAVTREDFTVTYPDGTATAAYLDVEDASAFPPGPIVPTLTPVLNPKVDGRDATVLLRGVNVRTLSWDPPAVGKPTAYIVKVLALAPGALPLLTFVTTATSLSMDGAECGGSPCAFEIDAVVSPVDLTSHPNRTSVPYTVAPMLTAELEP